MKIPISYTLTLYIILSFSMHAIAIPLIYSDFGLTLNGHHQIDQYSLPQNVVVGNFNGDNYPDIARFMDNRIEVFLRQGNYFSKEPSMIKYFDKTITSIRTEGEIWIDWWDIVVTLSDGKEERIPNSPNGLMIEPQAHPFDKFVPPPKVTEADFELVWQTNIYNYGMYNFCVGDVDNDSINELISWFKEGEYDDTCWVITYKCYGDNNYELFSQDYFTLDCGGSASISNLMITDIDQNGQKELCITANRVYFWEFSEPGVFERWYGTFNFSKSVQEGFQTDFDADGLRELTFLTSNSSNPSPTTYLIKEFNYKSSSTVIYFNHFSGMSSDRYEVDFDVGDLDNDGVMDIVTTAVEGGGGSEVNIKYFRYDSTQTENFEELWLETEMYQSCVLAEIADYDMDDYNELLVSGLDSLGGSVYIWEPTGLGTGYVVWNDNTIPPGGPHLGAFGIIDNSPAFVQTHNGDSLPILTSLFACWIFHSYSDVEVFVSPEMEYAQYMMVDISDIDKDYKKEVIISDVAFKHLDIWEQTSTWVIPVPHERFPVSLELSCNYPNPFNATTIIQFTIDQKLPVKIVVYNQLGQNVVTLFDGMMDSGMHHVNWNAGSVSSGVYLIRLDTQAGYSESRKVLLVK
jgi:hypothetical protein